MTTLILGAGVIGTTAAWYLTQAGERVVVIDRQPGPGLETSFANAGEISPGYASPWAGPGVPRKAMTWLLMQHAPLVIRPLLDPAMWRWCVAMLGECNARRYAINKARMVRLAEYSRDMLQQLRAQTGIRYDERSQGTLQLFRTAAQMEATAKDIAVLKEGGVPYELYDGDGYLRHEPALARVKSKFVGALRLPGDETGDCLQFTQALATMAAAAGATFRFGESIRSLVREGDRVAGVVTDRGLERADRVLLALGSYSTAMVAPLGIRMPVHPVKGYSITVPIRDAEAAPQSTIMDESHKVAVTRLGDRIRVGGTAELAGFDLTLRPERRSTLEFVVQDLFPDGGDVEQASFWCGLRPMTPDGTPVVGPTPLRDLWLATGHGTLGWTMACGTGQLLADWMTGRRPAIDTEGLGVERYAR